MNTQNQRNFLSLYISLCAKYPFLDCSLASRVAHGLLTDLFRWAQRDQESLSSSGDGVFVLETNGSGGVFPAGRRSSQTNVLGTGQGNHLTQPCSHIPIKTR